jgi:hypothetical protein
MRKLVLSRLRRVVQTGGLEVVLQPGMPVVAGEMLVPFERVEDDWTERGPACERRRTAAQRVFSTAT